MRGHTPSAEQQEKLLRLKAAVAELIARIAGLDITLVTLLAEILHPPPFAHQDIELASTIVFSQTTLERRVDIVRKVLTLRLAPLLKDKPHEYTYKVGAFLLKVFNLLMAEATKDAWIRNTVAHGNYLIPLSGEPRLVPLPFDFDSVERLNTKRGMAPRRVFKPDAGFTAAELDGYAKAIITPQIQMALLRNAVMLAQQRAPEALELALIELGKDLKLQAPLRDRPRRERREPRKPK